MRYLSSHERPEALVGDYSKVTSRLGKGSTDAKLSSI